MKSNATQKIAIFGGSFAPVHFGHVDIVHNLERRFDRVIVMPTYVSPFKAGGESDGALRLKMCRIALASQKTQVSGYEIRKKSVSYTVDTAGYLAKKFGGQAKLFWVIGSEELNRLLEWRDIDRLKNMITFYVVPRPQFEPNVSTLAALKKRKIKIRFAPFIGLDISSTRIKIDNAFGKDNAFVPAAVRAIADEHGLFDPYAPYVRALRAHRLSSGRMGHTYRVACRGAELAKMYGADVKTAVIACILHDIGKSENVSDYADKVDISGYPAPTAHAAVGAYIAKRELNVSDEIASAIKNHSTGNADMSVLDEIVYLADKTEEGRTYASLDRMRYLCAYDKNVAMLAALTEIHRLENSDNCVYSERAIAHYKAIVGDAPIPELPEPAAMQPTAEKNQPAKRQSARRKAQTQADIDPQKQIALAVADELNKHKGYDIIVVDLNGKTIVADYFVICSCSSSTAVKALTDYAEDRLSKQFGLDPSKRDVNSEWVALDYGTVIVHIFTEQTRKFYNIERLWSDGKNIERYGD